MRIALAQLLAGDDPAANLDQVDQLVGQASAQGAELVLFPEATMRCFGRSLTEVAEPLDGPWGSRLGEIAAHHQVVVAAGMFTPAPDGRVLNTLLVRGPGVGAHYDKIHLFDAFGFAESDTVAPGSEPLVVEVAGVQVGFTTCYDVRFPGLFTTLADRGAQLICVCASWGAGPGKVEQWEVLVRARALDSTTFVAAVGQADPDSVGVTRPGGAPTGVGHSLVVSPTGEIIDALEAEPGLLVVDLDASEVSTVRRVLPVLANRRF
ncbi:MAG TPA: carbon-nitrogen hydrolase family protein [Propionibacteriaceae bacterium]|nr:carbon-nitrogen hydrolase family protein [Propionibacteriaceae bacterium]